MNAQNPAPRWLIILLCSQLCLGFLVGIASHLVAQTPASPFATFKNVEALAEQTNDGLRGVAVKFELQFKSTPPVGPNSPYAVLARLLDAHGQPLFAASDAKGYTDLLGYCRDSTGLIWPTADAVLGEQAMFVPYFAMGLPAGENHVKVWLQLIDQRTKQILAFSEAIDLRFQKPALKLYRMRVDRLEAYTTDADGETWDYKFLNARDIYPDLIWSLRRGHHDVFESPKQKNDTIYIGTDADQSPWVWLSEGDRIHFYVRDFDLLGFSDMVGSLGIDIWQPSFVSGRMQELKFERVRRARVVQEAITPPKLAITQYEVIDHDQYGGMSGTRIKLEYAVSGSVPNAKFVLEPHLRSSQGSWVPQALYIVGAGAVPFMPGAVELTGSQSSLELFVPHYALPDSLPMGATMQVEASVRLGVQQGFVLTRLQRPLLGSDDVISDMAYGQWKVGVHEIAGRGGLRISLDYELPESYFQGLENAKITLEPHIEAAWGPIDNQLLEVLGPETTGWDGGKLTLSKATRKGTLDLFLPFASCPPGGGTTSVSASYRTTMDYGGRSIGLGIVARESEVELPNLQVLSLGLREASVARSQWILSHPSMYWELHCGDKLLHRSRIVPDLRNARWADDDVCTCIVAPSDRIELRVYHKVTDGLPDRLLDIWSGQLSELPGREHGNVRLPADDLKRMLLHLDYADVDKEDGRQRNGRDR